MISDRVKIGNRIEITQEEVGRKKYHRTKIDDILSETRIVVQSPLTTSGIFRVKEGQKLELYSFEDGLIYLYMGRVVKMFTDDKIDMIELDILTDAKESQRREFFRFDCSLEMKYDNLNNTLKDKEIQPGTIKNIGGGGLKFLCNEDLDLRDKVQCVFKFREIDFDLTAIIVGKEKLEDGFSYKFRYRGKWDRMTRRSEDQLVKCIFEQQVAQNR